MTDKIQNTTLGEEEKRKIEEEEKIRAEAKAKAEKEIKQKEQKKKNVGCLVGIVLFIVLIVLLFNSCGETPTTQPSTPSILGIGEEGIINNNSNKSDVSGVAVLAVDKKALDDLIQAQIADDKLGYSQMLGDGKLFIVDNGTKVKVIDIGFGKTEIRILEGEHLGKSGWIAYEFVIQI